MKIRPKKNCLQCNKEFIKPTNFGLSKWNKKKFCSLVCSAKSQIGIKRKPHTEEFKKQVSLRHTGKVNSLESRKKMSITKIGELNPNWKGGISPLNTCIRMSMEYRLWRNAVLERDNYTCIWCGLKQGWNKELKKQNIIHADHIKPFCDYPELRFAIDNGRTLCIDCHKTTDTWGARASNVSLDGTLTDQN